ncbi:MAG: SUMF1/EgtB/PvdO family nonheme iron enzyme [Terriglobia bacterium]
MERRNFLKDSAVAAGVFIADRNLAFNASLAEHSGEGEPTAPQMASLVKVPGTSYQTVDPYTTVPVTITIGDFLICPAEITQREFEETMGYNPAFHKGPNLPVETVSWWEAIRYCNLRSTKDGLEPCYDLESGFCNLSKNGYRLPTEAEWVHAAGPVPPPSPARTNECGLAIPGSRTSSSGPSAQSVANLGGYDTKSVDDLLQELKTSGTKAAGGYPPNEYGLYDMYGNVWEWCNDFFDPVPKPERSFDPAGPERGLDRVMRGGSFISNGSAWSDTHGPLKRPGQGNAWSCMEASYKSRFTGFRVCRSITTFASAPVRRYGKHWFEPYNQPPSGYESTIGNLAPLVSAGMTLSDWDRRRSKIESKWLKLLGDMETSPPQPKTRLIGTVKDQNYSGKIMRLQTEPDSWVKILVLMPHQAFTRPFPVVLVPFYDVDDPAGRDLSGCAFFGGKIVAFARMAVQRGFLGVAVRWWEADYGPADTEAVAHLKLKHPRCTGLGKWVWDAHRVVDYLYTLPEVDRERIGIIGHSMGGKMALYAGAFDERIRAVVASEPGIGLDFSNYDDYWYFGDFIHGIPKGTDQHELLGLTAPRPFLLIGGDMCDTAKSWYYINAAREVYKLYGKPQDIGYYIHYNKQHNPTPEADKLAMEWLTHFLGTESMAATPPQS